MNQYENELSGDECFEPMRRSRRVNYARRRGHASAEGFHRRRRRHWRPPSKVALALHTANTR
jgi:hypothetical protein